MATPGPAADSTRTAAIVRPNLQIEALTRHGAFLLFVLDTGGTILWTLPGDGLVLGWTPDDVVGHSALDLVDPQDRERAAAELARTVAAGPGISDPVEFGVLHADGTPRVLELVANNRLEDPAVGGIVVTAVDVTEHRRVEAELQASEERARVLFSALAEAAVVVDVTSARIVDLNEPLALLYGYSVAEMIGMPVAELSTEPDATLAALASHHEGLATVTRQHRRRDGTTFLAEISYGRCEMSGLPTAVGVVRDVSVRHEREVALTESTALLQALVENSSEVISIIDGAGRWRWTSVGDRPNVFDPPDESTSVFDYVHADDHDLARRAFEAVTDGRGGVRSPFVMRVRARDGSYRFLESVARDLRDDPIVKGILVNTRDVTEHYEGERLIRQLSQALETSHDVVALVGDDGRATYVNTTARELLGIEVGEDLPSSIRSVMVPEAFRRLRDEIRAVAQASGCWRGEITVRDRHGGELVLMTTVGFEPGDEHQPPAWSFIAHDITALKRAQAQLEHQATHDPLTGLPNRQLFEELGEQALARATRDGTTVAVLFLDLDRFKPINDRMGHATGDVLLVEVARRLRAAVRGGDIVARFGGDEFIVLCEHPAGAAEMGQLARRLVAALQRPFELEHPGEAVDVVVGASVGIAVGGGSRATIAGLLRDADAALLEAKDAGRGQVILFGESGANRSPNPPIEPR